VRRLRDLDAQRQAPRAAHQERIDVLDLRLPALEGGEAGEQLLQRDARLEARERGAQAEVDAEAESEVALRVARHVEAVGFRPWHEHWLGILITPWFMNLVLMPRVSAMWNSIGAGESRHYVFPAGVFPKAGFAYCDINESGFLPGEATSTSIEGTLNFDSPYTYSLWGWSYQRAVPTSVNARVAAIHPIHRLYCQSDTNGYTAELPNRFDFGTVAECNISGPTP